MKLTALCLLLFLSINLFAQPLEANLKESEVPNYKLPELLVSKNGRKIKNVRRWEKIRRPELLKIFNHEIYGKIPKKIDLSDVMVHEANGEAFDGLAKRKQVELIFKQDDKEVDIGLLLYLPINNEKAPIFLGYNFSGNHTVSKDPNIRLTESWVQDDPSLGIVHNQVTEQSRGVASERWPIRKILEAGYGVATMYCGDVDPDRDNFQDGIHPFAYDLGQFHPGSDQWGTITAWAWGLSKAMDYLETDPDVDSTRVVVFGWSRLGKAAVWAAALDQRFAMCISNESGCMGAALSRRRFGETVAIITHHFPYWFCENLNKYSGQEDKLPVDQHELLALIAPRPLYVASATEDLWSDPKGEFLSAVAASKVWELYGKKGLPITEMPEPDTPVMDGDVAYHIRTGKHNITNYDWTQYIKFADKELKPKE
ncbi:MAG TPA: hypothetical protein VKA27_10390 [Sunxiuqinia sp.]|nr:hypothetical protein [Sunxiuqinia sp.]